MQYGNMAVWVYGSMAVWERVYGCTVSHTHLCTYMYGTRRKLSDVSEGSHRPAPTSKRQKTELDPTPPPRRTKQSKTHPTEAVIEPQSSKHKSK